MSCACRDSRHASECCHEPTIANHPCAVPDCCCVAMRSEDSRLARDDWHSGEDGTIGCRLRSVMRQVGTLGSIQWQQADMCLCCRMTMCTLEVVALPHLLARISCRIGTRIAPPSLADASLFSSAFCCLGLCGTCICSTCIIC